MSRTKRDGRAEARRVSKLHGFLKAENNLAVSDFIINLSLLTRHDFRNQSLAKGHVLRSRLVHACYMPAKRALFQARDL